MSDDAIGGIDHMIATLQRLPREAMDRVFDEFARVIEADIRATIAAGTAPDGTPWPLRKADGGRALVNVGDKLEVEVVSDGVFVRLMGFEVLHHRGHSRGHVKRQVIYTGDMPPRVAAKLEAAAGRVLDEVMKQP